MWGNNAFRGISLFITLKRKHYAKSKVVFFISLLLAIWIINFQIVESQASSSNYIKIKVIDANTSEPVHNASIIVWDMDRPSASFFSTDSNGEYNFTEAQQTHLYRIYAYRGNLTLGVIDYAPQVIDVRLSSSENSRNVTFRLVPAAAVHLTGAISVVEAVGPPNSFTVYLVDPKASGDIPPVLNGSFVSVYNPATRYFLREKSGLNKNFIFVPAGVSIDLKFDAAFYTIERGIFHVVFFIENIHLNQGAQASFPLEEYSLRKSIETVRDYIKTTYNELDKAQRAGFYLAGERRTLDEQMDLLIIANQQLSAGNPEGYKECWSTLRSAYAKTTNVLTVLQYYILVSASNAIYLPAFFAVYSVIFAFFIFEDDRKKMLSSLVFYAFFIAILFAIYPGTKIIASQNLNLFASVAGLSIAVTLAIVFVIPRRWKLSVEGLFSLRDVITALFSMGKRQIKIRKARGLLTLSSLIILVLAFTALTSFGVVYGITKETMPYTSRVDGTLMKRTGNVTFVYGQREYPLFKPFDTGYYQKLLQLLTLEYAAPKIETYPRNSPVARITSETGETVDIYGVVGVDPKVEALITRLNETIPQGEGKYLDEEDPNGLLISSSAAEALSLRPNQTIKFIAEGIVLEVTVRGIFSDSAYEQLSEIDGQPFGPKYLTSRDSEQVLTICNATNVVIMNWQTAIDLQRRINIWYGREEMEPGTFNSLSRIAFKPAVGYNIERIVDIIINDLYCDLYVSEGGTITRHYIGYYYEAKGAIELLFPLVMAGLNVAAVMLNAVYERRGEMKILTVIGSNPAHLAMLFVAEAVVLGMVGGGLGYLFGLGFYRVMALFGTSLMVREKLEWWWSALGFGLAILASVLSTLRPALLAVKMYTPSKVRRAKISEEEREARKEEIFKVYQARSVTMPIKVNAKDIVFFTNFLIGRLEDLRNGIYERVKDIHEEPETQTSRGRIIKKVGFDYIYTTVEKKISIKNEVICSKDPEEDYYRVQLIGNVENVEVSEEWIYRIVGIIRDITLDWLKNREKILGL